MMKRIFVDGMVCMHCKESVENALKAIVGINDVRVSLEDKCAQINTIYEIDDEVLKSTITDIGFEIILIQ